MGEGGGGKGRKRGFYCQEGGMFDIAVSGRGGGGGAGMPLCLPLG